MTLNLLICKKWNKKYIFFNLVSLEGTIMASLGIIGQKLKIGLARRAKPLRLLPWFSYEHLLKNYGISMFRWKIISVFLKPGSATPMCRDVNSDIARKSVGLERTGDRVKRIYSAANYLLGSTGDTDCPSNTAFFWFYKAFYYPLQAASSYTALISVTICSFIFSICQIWNIKLQISVRWKNMKL